MKHSAERCGGAPITSLADLPCMHCSRAGAATAGASNLSRPTTKLHLRHVGGRLPARPPAAAPRRGPPAAAAWARLHERKAMDQRAAINSQPISCPKTSLLHIRKNGCLLFQADRAHPPVAGSNDTAAGSTSASGCSGRSGAPCSASSSSRSEAAERAQASRHCKKEGGGVRGCNAEQRSRGTD